MRKCRSAGFEALELWNGSLGNFLHSVSIISLYYPSLHASRECDINYVDSTRPQNPSINTFQNKTLVNRRNFKALKLWKGLSGPADFNSCTSSRIDDTPSAWLNLWLEFGSRQHLQNVLDELDELIVHSFIADYKTQLRQYLNINSHKMRKKRTIDSFNL